MKKIIVIVIGFSALAVIAAIILVILKSTRPAQVLQVGAGLRPTCSNHNDCPNNWMYCSGGECYSYTTGGGVGKGCNINKDCGNMMLNCVNGTCQRVVGEPGGCSISQDCADQYRNTDPGAWSCTNSQCIKLGGRSSGTAQYFDGTNWQNYWSSAACVLNADCGPGRTCSEYGCFWFTNRNPCYGDGECGLLPSDPNKKYVCVNATGQNITYKNSDGTVTGTCQLWDACDSRLEMVGGPTCGPGTHCEARTSMGTPMGQKRRGMCVADAGTTASAGQTPQEWISLECPGGTVIERCSSTATNQRVRYCSNDPTNTIRWNGWQGPNNEYCIKGGEVRGAAGQTGTLPTNVPAGFYDTTGCALGTRVERCSNTYLGQRVSYCTEDEANPERSVVRVNNWVGPNGETCGLNGENIASPSAWRGATPTPKPSTLTP